MIFRSKVSSAAQKTRPCRIFACAAAGAILCSAPPGGAYGASYSRVSFPVTGNGVADSNVTIENGALGLAVSHYFVVKNFGDSTPAVPISAVTFFPDVVANGDSTFIFFWADSLGINKRDYRMQGGSAAPLAAPARIASIVPGSACYLHSDKGENGYLASYIATVGPTRIVQACNGTAQYDIDSTASAFCYVSQCAAEQDTYCIVHITNLDSLLLTKVFARGTEIRTVSSVVVATGAPINGQSLMNPSVAADSSGTIAVSWSKGGLLVTKNLYCRFFDRALQPLCAETQLATNICNADTMHYYDNAPITSYRRGHFALASWDSAGVLLHTVSLAGTAVDKSSVRVVSRPNVRFTAIAAWRRYIVVACKGDVDNNGNRGVEGRLFEIKSGEPDIQNGMMFRFSNPLVPDTTRDRFCASLNCAIDTIGNLALAWRHGARTMYCLWANKKIRHQSGFWMSPVESLSVAPADSTRFYPATVEIPDLSSWYVEDSLRTGRTFSDFIVSNPWTSLSGEAPLAALSGNHRYFQFRITLNRRSQGDSITTPAVESITIPWNAKPLVSKLDSLKVNGLLLPNSHFGDTVTLISRKDSLTAYVWLHDADSTGRLTLRTSRPAADSLLSLASSPGVGTAIRFFRMAQSDTAIVCTVSVADSFSWRSEKTLLHFRTRNSLPLLPVRVVFRAADKTLDTVSLASNARFDVQEDDSIAFLYSVADTNDSAAVKAYLYSGVGNDSTLLDSIASGAEKRFVFYGTGLPAADSITMSVEARDPDTTVRLRATIVANHLPSITKVTIDGETIHSGDTVRVLIGKRADIAVSAADADLAFWDTLQCLFATKEKTDSSKSNTLDFEYGLLPSRGDTLLDITVRDVFGRIDTMRFYLKYPWLALDSASNPAYAKALDSLNTALSLIVGANVTDSIAVPLINTGNDTMHLFSLYIPSAAGHWLSMGIPQGDSIVRFTAATAPQLQPVLMRPREKVRCMVYVTADSCRGDSVVRSRCILGVSDFAHAFDTIPVRLEYNDLPRILKVAPDWDSTKPFTPGGIGTKGRVVRYRFPPHAAIGIDFSESIDSASAARGLRVYSVFDSAAAGAVRPITMKHRWNAAHTRLTLIAGYTAESPHFKITPPPRLFIPTDSIALAASPALTDCATTPSGPNGLDIDNDNKCDTGGSALFPMRLDSITFCLLSVTPAGGDTGVAPGTPLSLTFSAPVLRSSLDTSLSDNRSLVVVSRYSAGKQIPYDSVSLSGNTVRFYPGVRLFYNDSVGCRYRSISIRDSMGFPSDNTHDGIPLSLFDSLTSGEDVTWRFKVKGIGVLSVGPGEGETVPLAARPVVLTFSDKVPLHAFDTATSGNNRSFTLRSLYGGPMQSVLSGITFSPDSTAVTLMPANGYFSGDSIHCQFMGFPENYRYGSADNLPGKAADCFSGTEWFFRTAATGFYIYPCPYKPGKDPRHCGAGGPCGIWFKNLHALAKGAVDFRVCVFSMKAHPVYDTKKAGLTLHFNPGDQPQWLWKTTNQSGEPVGSGVYFYAVFDKNDKALVKGKLMIVR